MWFGYALTFAILSSISGVIAKHVLEDVDEYTYLFASSIFTIPVLFSLFILFFEAPDIDKVFILSLITASIISAVAAVLAYRAIKISEISLVSPISSFNPVFTTIVSFATLNEKIGWQSGVGILLIVFGAYLLQISKFNEGVFEPLIALFSHKGVQLSLIAYFIWAITPTFEKTAIAHTNPETPAFASLISAVISFPIYGGLALKKGEVVVGSIKKFYKYFLLVGLLGGVGAIAAFTAFNLANLGPVTAIFKLSMIFTVFWGWLFFKEKNIKDRLIGSFVMLLGVYVLVS